MTFTLDSQIITIPCPQCGKQLKEKIGRLKREKKIACSVCGPMTVNADQLSAIERSINEQLAQLKRKITLKL
ncbi:hypothetical protein [Dechloromonas sp. CZR5]|uniref:hypothetical protein n=1 Tax=Dechloromonas sp. CZR5 TaxID=2608630 RepID=UPI00123D887C|nr:hypothetical protein [Dechloromonas sp. CZR5]